MKLKEWRKQNKFSREKFEKNVKAYVDEKSKIFFQSKQKTPK